MACGSAPGLLKSDWAEYNNKAQNDPDLNKALKKLMKYYLYAVANSNALNGFDADIQAIDSSAQISSWQVALTVGGVLSLTLSVVGIAFYIVISIKKAKKEENMMEGM
jgi:hypothetical protein